MILGLLTLLTALCISGIAAYYSIVGLTAIFAAAFWPIVIMGSVLELGKVVTTLWLHYNWERADWKIKAYLTGAVAVLMFITSMGIFGFLSKAHLEQSVPSGDIQAQVSLFDEKIKTQRDNIESARKALAQMDGAVDQTLSRSTGEDGATKSANLRRSQAKERTRLQTDIDTAQKEIAKLQEQRAPIASQFRKVEAEVGPIKYIAALIYGDKADQNLLEAAVRWVIMIIVFVFDPLAIILILAATTSIDWSKVDRIRRKHEKVEQEKADAIEQADLAKLKASLEDEFEETVVGRIAEAVAAERARVEAEYEAQRLAECANCEARESAANAQIQQAVDQSEAAVHAKEAEFAELAVTIASMINEVNELSSYINQADEACAASLRREEQTKKDLALLIGEYDTLISSKHELEDALVQIKTELDSTTMSKQELEEKLVAATIDLATLRDDYERVKALAESYETAAPNIVEEVPESGILTDPAVMAAAAEAVFRNAPEYFHRDPSTLPQLPARKNIELPVLEEAKSSEFTFGTDWPAEANTGDICLRIDLTPSVLFKWNGDKWMEIDKKTHDSYAFNESYIQLLVEKVSTGEYDIDDLTDTEQEQVAQFLTSKES